MSRELRYWDANVFLAYFQEEEGRVDSCEAVLEEAEEGKILIVTSALTLAEVLALRGKRRISPGPRMRKKVIDFFKNEYIAVQNVTRDVAEMARDLVWDRGIKPKDAIHVASALVANISILETYDGPLIRKGKKVGLDIREPPLRAQPSLPLAGGMATRSVRKLNVRKRPTEEMIVTEPSKQENANSDSGEAPNDPRQPTQPPEDSEPGDGQPTG